MTVTARPDGAVVTCTVTDQALVAAEHEAAVADAASGAVVAFAGVVRDHDGGRAVSRLEYSAHPGAESVLAEVAAEVAARHPGIRIAVSHRVGPLEIGDVAVVAAVATPHRGEAFQACADLVDEVKARVPIWKHQHFADGTDEWVGAL
jgi:molybdopterin synthase catalytic subunit